MRDELNIRLKVEYMCKEVYKLTLWDGKEVFVRSLSALETYVELFMEGELDECQWEIEFGGIHRNYFEYEDEEEKCMRDIKKLLSLVGKLTI